MDIVGEHPVLPSLGASGHFRVDSVDVRADRLLRIQGYTDLDAVRRPIRRAAERAATMAVEIAEGSVGYRRLAVSALDDGVLDLGAGQRFRCAAFTRFLAGCESVLLFAMTVGPAFDARIDELMKGDQPVDGLFLDSAGWLAIESVTRQFADALKADLARTGGAITRRMGPGYSYRAGERKDMWPLEQQEALFDALGDSPLPVSLLESAAMHPKMSRSGLYGLRGVPAG